MIAAGGKKDEIPAAIPPVIEKGAINVVGFWESDN